MEVGPGIRSQRVVGQGGGGGGGLTVPAPSGILRLNMPIMQERRYSIAVSLILETIGPIVAGDAAYASKIVYLKVYNKHLNISNVYWGRLAVIF